MHNVLIADIEAKNPERVQECINRGMDINFTHNEEFTPLELACSMGDKTIVDILLKSPNIALDQQGSFLVTAAENNHTHIVERLLKEADINVNAPNYRYDTALIVASGNGNLSLVNLLLAKPEIDLQAFSFVFGTALTYAIYKQRWEIVDRLLEHELVGEKKFSDEVHRAAFIWAVRHNKCDLVQKLVNSGAEVNSIKWHDFERPDWIVTEIVQNNIDCPFSVSARTPTFNLPLVFAVEIESEEMIRLLINLGADPHLKGLRNQSAIDTLEFLDNEIAQNLKKSLVNESINPNIPKSTISSLVFLNQNADASADASQAYAILKQYAPPELLSRMRRNNNCGKELGRLIQSDTSFNSPSSR